MSSILDEPTHSEGFVPPGDFKALADAIAAGNIPADKVEEAAGVIQKAIADEKSASAIISIATKVIGGLVKFI